MTEHATDVGQEAHVEHAIGFVEHEVLEAAQLRVRLPEMIEQPPRRPDDDVDAAAEGVLLRAHADAAIHGKAAERRVDGEILQIFDNLRRQLARRRDDERARGARPAARLLHEAVQNRQQKRRGLPAARLGTCKKIAACERGWNGVGLNRRRFLKPEVFDAAKKVGVQL